MTSQTPHRFLVPIALLALVAVGAVTLRPSADVVTSVEPVNLAQAAQDEFPESWFYPDRNTGRRYALPKTLEGKAAPSLKLKDWIGEPQELEKLKGKVVVVDFWATWCRPCMQAIPKNVQMMTKYEDEGLMILGIHDGRRGFQRMPTVARQMKVNYPLAVDDGGHSVRSWRVSFWPLYAVVDHRGVVRAAGLRPDRLEPVVQQLLAERNERPSAPGS